MKKRGKIGQKRTFRAIQSKNHFSGIRMTQCGMVVPNFRKIHRTVSEISTLLFELFFYFPFLVLWTKGFYRIYMKIGRNVSWVGGKSPFEFLICGECFSVFFSFPAASALKCGVGLTGQKTVQQRNQCVYTPGLTGLHTDTL